MKRNNYLFQAQVPQSSPLLMSIPLPSLSTSLLSPTHLHAKAKLLQQNYMSQIGNDNIYYNEKIGGGGERA
jgi:hypothetical protein